MNDQPKFDQSAAHEFFAKSLNGRTWALLDTEQRSASEDVEMELAATASLYHWSQIGTAVHLQRGEWLLARVYTTLTLGEAALRHARRCLDHTSAHPDEMHDFDLAYSYEGMARSLAACGEQAEARSYYARAKAAAEAIEDNEDRRIFMDDFQGGEWFGLV